ncbi:hypothetical protein [Aeromonas salmonicida]
MFASQDPSREVTAFSIAIGPEQISLFIKNKKAAPESGFFHVGYKKKITSSFWPWRSADR